MYDHCHDHWRGHWHRSLASVIGIGHWHRSLASAIGDDEWPSQRVPRSIYNPCNSRREGSYGHDKDITSHLLTSRTLIKLDILQFSSCLLIVKILTWNTDSLRWIFICSEMNEIYLEVNMISIMRNANIFIYAWEI